MCVETLKVVDKADPEYVFSDITFVYTITIIDNYEHQTVSSEVKVLPRTRQKVLYDKRGRSGGV